MPIFEFECQQCATVSEEIISDRECKHSTCEICGGVSNKIMSVAGWELKGGGVYRATAPTPDQSSKMKQGHRRITTG